LRGHVRGHDEADRAELVARNGSPDPKDRLRWFPALGRNATPIGTSDHRIVLGIAECNGQRIVLWQFSKYRVGVTMITVAISTGYLWLRCFSLA